jgi:hypothetical protein
MSRKQDKYPERVLQTAIAEMHAGRSGYALKLLLRGGPLSTGRESFAQLQRIPAADVAAIAGEILAFLQRVARGRSDGYGLEGRFRLSPEVKGGNHVFATDLPDVRDVVLLQVVMLVQQVTPGRVLECPACRLPFVKHYRREYCSTLCQDRTDKWERRAGIRKSRKRKPRRREARDQGKPTAVSKRQETGEN